VHLEAVEGGAYVAEGEDLEEHDNWAIHHTDAAAQFLLTAVLHLAPNFLRGNTLDHQRILNDVRDHVVDEVEINVTTLKVANGLLKGILDIVTVSDPELANNEEVFTLANTALDDLLEGIPDSFLISVDGRSIDASEAALNSVSEALEGVILVEVESAETHGGDIVAVTEGAHGDVGDLESLFLLTAVHHLLLLRLYLTGCHVMYWLSY
jgi:hypothetical protein